MIYSLTNDRHNATSEINTLIKCKVKKILPIFAAYGLLGIMLRTPTCRLNRMRAVSFFFFLSQTKNVLPHVYSSLFSSTRCNILRAVKNAPLRNIMKILWIYLLFWYIVNHNVLRNAETFLFIYYNKVYKNISN